MYAHPRQEGEILTEAFIDGIHQGFTKETCSDTGDVNVQVPEAHALHGGEERTGLPHHRDETAQARHETHGHHGLGALEHDLQAGRRVEELGVEGLPPGLPSFGAAGPGLPHLLDRFDNGSRELCLLEGVRVQFQEPLEAVVPHCGLELGLRVQVLQVLVFHLIAVAILAPRILRPGPRIHLLPNLLRVSIGHWPRSKQLSLPI
mmetsp:Transcript_46028/g.109383  ORF Transcript_46028/g.109383 Transcript_46028/m.109383 type:complete len:204 (+) Transcript_46028:1174-1785(+)